jgi:hypothetical protein
MVCRHNIIIFVERSKLITSVSSTWEEKKKKKKNTFKILKSKNSKIYEQCHRIFFFFFLISE